MSEAPELTISIATYDRPELLQRTIASCLAQRNRLGLAYEILITDNHPSGNGRATAELAGAGSAIPVRYQSETARNMSVLRNAGITGARGALLAFIDDDEFADPEWLDELVGALRRTGSDIAIGLRLAIFAAGAPPPYDPTAKFFVRDLHLAQDADVALVRADGKVRYGLGTGNSLFRVDTCFTSPTPFSLQFGDAGGEDSELFMRLYLEGRRIVWTPAARVTEIVPAHRTEIPYRLLRTKRETQIYVSTYLHHAPRPRRVSFILRAKGLLQLAAGLAIACLTWEFGSPDRLRGRLLITFGYHKLFRRRAVGYIDEPAHRAPPPDSPPS